MSVLDNYKSNIVLDLRPGSLVDHSDYANTVTPTGGSWQMTRHGKGYSAKDTNKLTVTHEANLALTSFTAIFLFDKFRRHSAASNVRFFQKGVGANRLAMYHSAANNLYLHFNGTDSTLNVDLNGKSMIAVRLVSGQNPDFFVDGDYVGQGSVAHTVTANTDALTLLNYASAQDQFSAHSPCSRIVFLDTGAITDEHMAKLWNELSAYRGAGDPKTKRHYLLKGIKDPSLKMRVSGEIKNGLLTDLSDNGVTFTNSGMVNSHQGFGGNKACRGLGDDYAFSLNDGNVFEGSYSFTVWIKRSNVAGSTQCLISRSPCYVALSATRLVIVSYFNSTAAQTTVGSTTTLIQNKWQKVGVSLAVSGSDVTVKIYIDGRLDKTQVNTTGFSPASATGTCLNALSVSSNFCTFDWFDMCYYNEVKDDDWFRNDYAEDASFPLYTSDSKKWLPTLADVTAGRMSNTDFTANTGTWKVSEDSDKKKWLQQVANGAISRPNIQAFGTYVYEINLVSFSSENSIGFIASGPGNYSSYTGYAFYVWGTGDIGVLRCNGGGSTRVIQSATGYIAINTTYKIAITRSASGIFNLYIRGGAYTAWTLVDTSPAFLTYPTSKVETIFSSNAGSKFRQLGTHQGVLTINELSQLY